MFLYTTLIFYVIPTGCGAAKYLSDFYLRGRLYSNNINRLYSNLCIDSFYGSKFDTYTYFFKVLNKYIVA